MKTGNAAAEKIEPYLTLEEGQLLVRLARQAIAEHLKKKKLEVPQTSERLNRKSGVFVTLNRDRPRELRGCIGFPYPESPLKDATVRAAIYAATEDPRFDPISFEEFQKEIVVEVTVLTPPRTLQVRDRKRLPELVKVGRHGLIVEGYGTSGLLLPQVAVEWKWDSEEFLSNCCMKAGLPPDYWLLDGTAVKVFEGEIFEETRPGGDIRKRLDEE